MNTVSCHYRDSVKNLKCDGSYNVMNLYMYFSDFVFKREMRDRFRQIRNVIFLLTNTSCYIVLFFQLPFFHGISSMRSSHQYPLLSILHKENKGLWGFFCLFFCCSCAINQWLSYKMKYSCWIMQVSIKNLMFSVCKCYLMSVLYSKCPEHKFYTESK